MTFLLMLLALPFAIDAGIALRRYRKRGRTHA